MIVTEGEEAFLKMLFQGDNIILPAGNNWYLGLCEQTPDKGDVLTDITTEPSAAGGYARVAIIRNNVDFPSANIGQVGGETRILSLVKTFSAVGADFSRTFDRAFICNVASGTAGILFAFTGQYSSPIQLLDGQSQDMQFEFYP